MADTYTTNLNLTKPEIGASTDTWGNKLNDNADALDALFPSGDLAVANGGTGASSAANARTNLGLGTMATQNANAVAISGGTAIVGSVTVSSTVAEIAYIESDAPADNRRWTAGANGQAFRISLENDGATVTNPAITISRAGASPSVVNIGTTLQVSGNAVYHAGNISAASITESQIADSSILARVGSTETITGAWTFSTAPSVPAATVTAHQASLSIATTQLTGTLSNATVAVGNVTQHQASLTIAETQISDGSVLARIGGNETISGNWTFSGTMTKGSAGRIPYLADSGNTGGAITLSTSDASGIPGNGDIWIKYVA